MNTPTNPRHNPGGQLATATVHDLLYAAALIALSPSPLMRDYMQYFSNFVYEPQDDYDDARLRLDGVAGDVAYAAWTLADQLIAMRDRHAGRSSE